MSTAPRPFLASLGLDENPRTPGPFAGEKTNGRFGGTNDFRLLGFFLGRLGVGRVRGGSNAFWMDAPSGGGSLRGRDVAGSTFDVSGADGEEAGGVV